MMKANSRIVVSHPGAGVFAHQAARALFEAGMLQRFVTTIADRPNAPWRRLVPADSWLDQQLRRRLVPGLPATMTTAHPGRELLRLLVRQFDRGGVQTDRVWEWAELGFDAWVARNCLAGAQAVYAYEHAALDTFQAAAERGMVCIYDVPAPEHGFAQRVRDQEIAAHPELDSAYERRTRRRCAQRTQRRREEWQMADLVLANSGFTRSTNCAAGLGESKVRIIVPGAPAALAGSVENTPRAAAQPVRFLFVGAVAVHKGVHHLLEAWKRLRVSDGTAVLEIVGDVTLPRGLLRRCPESVHFVGRLKSEDVFCRYRRADALVFPTLCDGFGMVVTEAFSQGLPVITTPRAGAAELGREGGNGFVVPVADPDALARALDWCLTHRVELRAMRAEARATAAAWQWSDYRQRLIEELLESPVDRNRTQPSPSSSDSVLS